MTQMGLVLTTGAPVGALASALRVKENKSGALAVSLYPLKSKEGQDLAKVSGKKGTELDAWAIGQYKAWNDAVTREQASIGASGMYVAGVVRKSKSGARTFQWKPLPARFAGSLATEESHASALGITLDELRAIRAAKRAAERQAGGQGELPVIDMPAVE